MDAHDRKLAKEFLERNLRWADLSAQHRRALQELIEVLKMPVVPEGTHDSLVYLTYDHRVVSRITDVGSESDLRWHLHSDHEYKYRETSPNWTKKNMALMHFLSHAELGALKVK